MKKIEDVIRGILNLTATLEDFETLERFVENTLHVTPWLEMTEQAYRFILELDLETLTTEQVFTNLQLRRSLHRLLTSYGRQVPPTRLE